MREHWLVDSFTNRWHHRSTYKGVKVLSAKLRGSNVAGNLLTDSEILKNQCFMSAVKDNKNVKLFLW